jgi:hypothetical protein
LTCACRPAARAARAARAEPHPRPARRGDPRGDRGGTGYKRGGAELRGPGLRLARSRAVLPQRGGLRCCSLRWPRIRRSRPWWRFRIQPPRLWRSRLWRSRLWRARLWWARLMVVLARAVLAPTARLWWPWLGATRLRRSRLRCPGLRPVLSPSGGRSDRNGRVRSRGARRARVVRRRWPAPRLRRFPDTPDRRPTGGPPVIRRPGRPGAGRLGGRLHESSGPGGRLPESSAADAGSGSRSDRAGCRCARRERCCPAVCPRACRAPPPDRAAASRRASSTASVRRPAAAPAQPADQPRGSGTPGRYRPRTPAGSPGEPGGFIHPARRIIGSARAVR